jgi:hypothetical protein
MIFGVFDLLFKSKVKGDRLIFEENRKAGALIKESIIDPDLIGMKISPRPSLPSRPEALWAGGQRGVIPPFGLRPSLRLRRASGSERAVSDPEGKGR